MLFQDLVAFNLLVGCEFHLSLLYGLAPFSCKISILNNGVKNDFFLNLGVTARELCYYFFAPDVRMEWETTLEQATVLEKVADDTLIFLQLHKRVWPSAQRDALFWSHMRCIRSDKQSQTWIVCNQSTKHPNGPENQGGCLRVDLTVCFVCDTTVDPPYTWENASRDHLTTKITYCSVVNPGGWAPASVLRAVYKREYPRFLKRFTQYVDEKCRSKKIDW